MKKVNLGEHSLINRMKKKTQGTGFTSSSSKPIKDSDQRENFIKFHCQTILILSTIDFLSIIHNIYFVKFHCQTILILSTIDFLSIIHNIYFEKKSHYFIYFYCQTILVSPTIDFLSIIHNIYF